MHKCDNCGSSITEKNPVIAKLFMSPILKSRSRADHGSYSRHCDIGQCCLTWLNSIHWTPRLSREAYQDSRRTRSNGKHPGRALEAGTKTTARKA